MAIEDRVKYRVKAQRHNLEPRSSSIHPQMSEYLQMVPSSAPFRGKQQSISMALADLGTTQTFAARWGLSIEIGLDFKMLEFDARSCLSKLATM